MRKRYRDDHGRHAEFSFVVRVLLQGGRERGVADVELPGLADW
ncbi:hypothetical protein ABZW18_31555 [Streptomyces sp. NPDC004647]